MKMEEVSTLVLGNGRIIGGSNPCYIVAEIGQNHQGDIAMAKKLIKLAKDCKVDCVKFQKSDLKSKFTKCALSKMYDNENSFGKTYGDHKMYLEFSQDDFISLKQYADHLDIDFSASGMDMASVDFLSSLNLPFLKVASNDVNSVQYLSHAAKKGIPLILSSGMQSLESLTVAYKHLKSLGSKFCLLQCTSCYPTAPEHVNLDVMNLYKSELPGIPIGYSGHETGISISIAAVAMGAKVLERHITLDKNLKGSDHRSSLNPLELKELVSQVRIIEAAKGIRRKEFQPCESNTYSKLGKTIVAMTDLDEGEVLSYDNICAKVSAVNGIRCEEMNDIIGCKINRAMNSDEPIQYKDVLR